MKLIVISDTHGSTERAIRAVKDHPEASEILHLGDMSADAAEISRRTGLPAVAVKGNCEYGSAPDELVITRGGCRLFLTHGHKYGVGYSLLRLSLKAEEDGAAVALFGHTHVPLLEYSGGLLILNPGSISRPRGCKASYAVLTVENGGARAEIITV